MKQDPQLHLWHEREVHREGRRLRGAGLSPTPQGLVQGSPAAGLRGHNQCHSQALCTSTSCAAGAVDVGVRRGRQLEVHHASAVRAGRSRCPQRKAAGSAPRICSACRKKQVSAEAGSWECTTHLQCMQEEAGVRRGMQVEVHHISACSTCRRVLVSAETGSWRCTMHLQERWRFCSACETATATSDEFFTKPRFPSQCAHVQQSILSTRNLCTILAPKSMALRCISSWQVHTV